MIWLSYRFTSQAGDNIYVSSEEISILFLIDQKLCQEIRILLNDERAVTFSVSKFITSIDRFAAEFFDEEGCLNTNTTSKINAPL